MEKKLSIVIPVYNRGAVVGRTLQSIAAQTYRPLKVILVDNASADDTAAVLRAWQAEVSAPDFEVE
ncbi:MAG: glycosyltransferase, partial [Muribaculaceae bacterium]|nr:glycosyltransferase [Muribaculaceae bacterium]